MSDRKIVETRGLCKHFVMGGERIEVLKSLDLSVREGEMLGIIGASGAGKSTLLHILGLLDAPSAGTVLYEGEDPFALRRNERARIRNRQIGFIFQFHHLLPEFTALENVQMPALIAGIDRASAAERALDLLAAMGLEARQRHHPGELSGGEQQRVALARALILEPKILFADEPTGNLDSANGEQVYSRLVHFNRTCGTTIVMVTHNEALARRLDRCLTLVDGRLVA
ncbi:MAG: ABC transporter ATP-binding protein [Deltaproteobacteria bacterium]|nr:MAG: ABC transporter ATP-binding protein [Deltaproteobacteria bacterium]